VSCVRWFRKPPAHCFVDFDCALFPFRENEKDIAREKHTLLYNCTRLLSRFLVHFVYLHSEPIHYIYIYILYILSLLPPFYIFCRKCVEEKTDSVGHRNRVVSVQAAPEWIKEWSLSRSLSFLSIFSFSCFFSFFLLFSFSVCVYLSLSLVDLESRRHDTQYHNKAIFRNRNQHDMRCPGWATCSHSLHSLKRD
jgi:4-amino-4-deoxy-L-arabinose transferase-like glycosyltransferase